MLTAFQIWKNSRSCTWGIVYKEPHPNLDLIWGWNPDESDIMRWDILSILGSEVTQSCPTLCDPVDYSLPGSSIHGILQARILEWVAISFSRDLPYPGVKPGSPALRADALRSEPPGKPKREWPYFACNRNTHI